MSGKDEYPPLLPEGLHKKTVQELKTIVVDAFRFSNTRGSLWASFENLLNTITSVKLPCSIWVDGSFLTEKIDPNDVDFVVEVPINAFAIATPAQIDLLQKLSNQDFRKPEKLHSFVMFSAPSGHPSHPDSIRTRNQWQKDFGLSYVKKEPKGIAVVEANP